MLKDDNGENESIGTHFSDPAADNEENDNNFPLEVTPNLDDLDVMTHDTEDSSCSHAAEFSDGKMHVPSFGLKKDAPKQREQKKLLDIYQKQPNGTEAKARRIISMLKKIYKTKVLPVEKRFFLHSFCLPTDGEIQDAEFDARPMVLLLGQYSTGKTCFIRHLLGGQDFPGIHVGPEPTTDKFMALIHGENEGVSAERKSKGETNEVANTPKTGATTTGKIIKGNTLTVTPELPFASLAQFGTSFLQNFEGSVSSCPILHKMNLIDTPGVLSGDKQRLHRDYDFAQVAKWFADRSDMILLLFDAHKLDISDELKEVVEIIQPHNADKIRCVLNKADSVDREELVRVYGSLMWSMGKIFHTPEVIRVYTGSYWDEPLVHDDFRHMFETDENNLLNELANLSAVTAERKVNAFVKRIRICKAHMCILGHVRQLMPRWIGKDHVRERILNNLDNVFKVVENKYRLSEGDMPSVDDFRRCLETFEDFSIFPVADRSTVQLLDHLIDSEIPNIMKGSIGVTGIVESAQANSTLLGSPHLKARGLSTSQNLKESKQAMFRKSLLAMEESIRERKIWLALVAVAVLGVVVAVFALKSVDEASPELYPY